MNTDPISDYLTRLRNAIRANHKVVEVPASNEKRAITKILFEKGYILNYKFVDDVHPKMIKIALKYHPTTKQSAITTLKRVSRPGLRKYTSDRVYGWYQRPTGLDTSHQHVPLGCQADG